MSSATGGDAPAPGFDPARPARVLRAVAADIAVLASGPDPASYEAVSSRLSGAFYPASKKEYDEVARAYTMTPLGTNLTVDMESQREHYVNSCSPTPFSFTEVNDAFDAAIMAGKLLEDLRREVLTIYTPRGREAAERAVRLGLEPGETPTDRELSAAAADINSRKRFEGAYGVLDRINEIIDRPAKTLDRMAAKAKQHPQETHAGRRSSGEGKPAESARPIGPYAMHCFRLDGGPDITDIKATPWKLLCSLWDFDTTRPHQQVHIDVVFQAMYDGMPLSKDDRKVWRDNVRSAWNELRKCLEDSKVSVTDLGPVKKGSPYLHLKLGDAPGRQ